MREQHTVWFWICEHKDCGWKWLADGVDAPEKCAKCKRRGWHTKAAPAVKVTAVDVANKTIWIEPVTPANDGIPTVEVLPAEELKIGKPDLEALVSGIMERTDLAAPPVEETEPERLCSECDRTMFGKSIKGRGMVYACTDVSCPLYGLGVCRADTRGIEGVSQVRHTMLH